MGTKVAGVVRQAQKRVRGLGRYHAGTGQQKATQYSSQQNQQQAGLRASNPRTALAIAITNLPRPVLHAASAGRPCRLRGDTQAGTANTTSQNANF